MKMIYWKWFEKLPNSDSIVSTVNWKKWTWSLFSAEILNSLIQTSKKTDETISNDAMIDDAITSEKQDDAICECWREKRNWDCPPVCTQH